MSNTISNFIADLIESKSTKLIGDQFRTNYTNYLTNVKKLGIHLKEEHFDGLDEYTVLLMYFGTLKVDIMEINSKFQTIEISEKYSVLARAFIKEYKQNQRYLYWTLDEDALISIDMQTQQVDIVDGDEIVSTGFNQFRELANLILNPYDHPRKINRVDLNESKSTIVALRSFSNDVAVRLLNRVYVITQHQIDKLSEIVKVIG